MQVTFYELISTTLEKTLPRLIEKAYESGLKAVVRTENSRLKAIDSAMWTYTTMGFLPHGSSGDPAEFALHQPIWLTTGDDNPINAEVLVVTTETYVKDSGYQRLLDVYDGNDASCVKIARERMDRYKSAGCEVKLWKQNLKGAWEMGI